MKPKQSQLPAKPPRYAGAGFPSPAQDYEEDPVDLAGVLMPNPVSSFIVQTQGDSMSAMGILNGDWLVVDRSIEAFSGMVVVAWIEPDGFVVKRLRVGQDGQAWLDSATEGYASIKVPEGGLNIFGVVTARAGLVK